MWFGLDEFCWGSSYSTQLTLFLWMKLSSITIFQGTAQIFLISVILYKNVLFSWIFCNLLANSKLQNYCLSIPSWKKPLLKTVKYKWSVILPGSTANLKPLDPNDFFQSCTVFSTSSCHFSEPDRETRKVSVKKENLKWQWENV